MNNQKPSERIKEIRKSILQSETAGGEALALVLATLDYLDSQWEKELPLEILQQYKQK